MKNRLQKIPIPMAALILGLAALGNLWSTTSPLIRMIFGGVALGLFLAYILRLLLYPKKAMKEMDNPVMASIFAALPMSMMIFATYFKQWLPALAPIWWWSGLLLHTLLILWFTFKHVFPLKIEKLSPTWFVLYVGIACVGVTAPVVGQKVGGMIAVYFAIAALVVLLPLMTLRYFKGKPLPEQLKPTWMIFAAPTSLCIAGALASGTNPHPVLIISLQIIALLCYIAVLPSSLSLFTRTFSPAFSAYTFPFVISAIAVKGSLVWLKAQGIEYTVLSMLLPISFWIATLFTITALLRYLIFLFDARSN
jgi:exfoliative toxin A/B